MKSKFKMLAVASLLLSTSAFAGEQSNKGFLTIQVAGKTIAAISLADQPKGAHFSITSDPKATVNYDDHKGVAIIKGKFSAEVVQGKKSLLRISVEDGVATFEKNTSYSTSAPATNSSTLQK